MKTAMVYALDVNFLYADLRAQSLVNLWATPTPIHLLCSMMKSTLPELQSEWVNVSSGDWGDSVLTAD